MLHPQPLSERSVLPIATWECPVCWKVYKTLLNYGESSFRAEQRLIKEHIKEGCSAYLNLKQK